MKFWLWPIALLSTLTIRALSVPINVGSELQELDIRAPRPPHVSISLREWKKNDEAGALTEWHFGLVLYEGGIPSARGEPQKRFNLHHCVLSPRSKNMVYERYNKLVSANRENIHATAKVELAGGETDADTLMQNVEAVISKAKRSKIQQNLSHGFTNCLDYTLWAIQMLVEAHYVKPEGYQEFYKFYTNNQAAVREQTNPSIWEICNYERSAIEGLLETRDPECEPITGGSTGGPKSAPNKGKKVGARITGNKAATAGGLTKPKAPQEASAKGKRLAVKGGRKRRS